MKYEVMLALRYLRARRRQGFISLITLLSMGGVALGVCALIVVLSVMAGFEGELKHKILGLNAQVTVYGAGGTVSDPARVLKAVRAEPRVKAAAPFVAGQVMLVSQVAASGAYLRGLALPAALDVLSVGENLVQGSLDNLKRAGPGEPPGVLLGVGLARRLGLGTGMAFSVINPLGEDTPVGRAPKSETFRVAGVFESGLYQYDSAVAYTSLAAAQEFFNLGGSVSGVEAVIDDIYDAPAVAERLLKDLGPGYYARDWLAMNSSLFAALKLEKITMFVILILIVLVAAFGIVSSLIMLVMEKTKDIGILKAMGATRKSVRRVFMLEGLIIGGAGTILGAAGGLVLCALLARYQFITLPQDVYAISRLPVSVEPAMVALVCLSAVAISLAATIYPSRHAGALDPVTALRYE